VGSLYQPNPAKYQVEYPCEMERNLPQRQEALKLQIKKFAGWVAQNKKKAVDMGRLKG